MTAHSHGEDDEEDEDDGEDSPVEIPITDVPG